MRKVFITFLYQNTIMNNKNIYSTQPPFVGGFYLRRNSNGISELTVERFA